MNSTESQPTDKPVASVNYHSFLLRLWREDPRTAWRISLQSVEHAELVGFATLDHLMAHLMRLIESGGDGPNVTRRDDGG